MAHVVTVMIEIDLADDATDEQVTELIGAIHAQVEDDEYGASTGYRLAVDGFGY